MKLKPDPLVRREKVPALWHTILLTNKPELFPSAKVRAQFALVSTMVIGTYTLGLPNLIA